jgi:hypothetical protein
VFIQACRHSRGKVWGSDEVNVEGWKPLKRLPGHESGKEDKQFCSNLHLTPLRCNGCRMVTWRSLSCLGGTGLASDSVVWLHPWYVIPTSSDL